MAYTRQSDAVAAHDPLVVHAYVQNSAAATDVTIPVPWNDVRCVYIYSIVETAIDATGDCVLKFEFNAAGGTQIATMTVASSAAVGDIDEATFDTPSTAVNMFTEKSRINIEVDGSSAAAGALNIYFYFEPIL
jgi:hypothetical protein